ncbi:hypothetical protein BTO09_13825 [Gilvibacter sp. SZ-19]|uniref:OmpH family outer membrane protein n=1 Tax=Gilvibacter sp. SZ-19 TaxID=754429 RepID=UPI000B3CAA69|nr:OmpH family outer membrane protein [Gilvibacter sp. SZ-19]ARV13352.1 hypothetical protein BTO09_13825 [Gilvibacter sp. SZ-19]
MKARLVLAFLIGIIGNIFSQDTAGVFDLELVKLSMPLSEQSERSIKELETKYNDSLAGLLEQFENRVSDRPHIDYTPAELRKIQDSLSRMQDKLNLFRKNALAKIAALRQDLEQQINLRIAEAVKSFCLQKNIKTMFYKSELSYCDNCLDYTEELILFIRDK